MDQNTFRMSRTNVTRKLVILIKTCLDGNLKKVRVENYLSSSFPIENSLKQGAVLSPPLFNFALEYAIRKVQKTNCGLNINGTHQVLAYADDINLIGDDIRKIERNVLLISCKDIGLAVNTGKTKYMEVVRH